MPHDANRAGRLRWGTLGTGRIAKQFAAALATSRNGRLVAVATRGGTTPDAAEFQAARFHYGYEKLLADGEVDVVYIATPHPSHAEWAIKAAQADKHILCEKPIGLNAREAEAIIEAARRADVFLMEAFMYRCHPQTAKLVEVLRSGAIGEVRLIQASFGNAVPFVPGGRHHSAALAGGGILDMGGYCVSMSRLIAGVAAGQQLAEPVEVIGSGHIGQSGTDEWAAAILKFPSGILAQISTSVTVAQENAVRIFGTEGHIEMRAPWFVTGQRQGGRTAFIVSLRNGETQEVVTETPEWVYAIEADHVAEHMSNRQAAWPAPTWDDSLGNMRVLDAWRAAIGLRYPMERS
jgi:predicted dehydrogenase